MIRPIDVIQWSAIAIAVLLLYVLLTPAQAAKTYTGYIFSWPSNGNGLVMGWTQTGFTTRADCMKWVVDRRVQAGRGPHTVTHDITGGCQ